MAVYELVTIILALVNASFKFVYADVDMPDFLFTPPGVREVMEAGKCMMNTGNVLV